MSNRLKSRIAFEVLMILAALLIFCVVTRIWPLVFLIIPGIIIAALKLLFTSFKKEILDTAPVVLPPPRHDTEQDVIRVAFGILQRRVTEDIASRYPYAGWVWKVSDTMERFAEGLPLSIILNSAGGYRKATVQVCNLQFNGLVYESAQTIESPPETDLDSYTESDDEPVDYALIAFQWVEANLLELNNRGNNAIADGLTTMLIPVYDLPHPDSWAAVCDELIHSGFSEAAVQENGISVTIPK